MRLEVSFVALLTTLQACTGTTGVDTRDASHEASVDVRTGDSGTDTPSITCTTDRDCADDRFCNGQERCAPGAPGADRFGCTAGTAPCTARETCNEAASRCETPCGTGGDADGDGHRSMACGGDDCDDNDANRYPGNPEVCLLDTATGMRIDPGHDEDCNPSTYANAMTHDGDVDGDGYVDRNCTNADSSGMVVRGSDCLDVGETHGAPPFTMAVPAANVHPTATEACNGVDDDCNGSADDTLPSDTYFRDCDGDGYGDAVDPGARGCSPEAFPTCMGHAYLRNRDDCDDSQATVHPMQPETCDAIDNDCDGTIDGASAAGMCTLASSASAMTCTAGACVVASCAAGHADCDHLASNGCEVDLLGDIANCGSCGHVCPSPGGTPSCSSGTCGISACSSGTYLCGGSCVPPTTSHCGASCEVCTAPANGTVGCPYPFSGCVVTCDPGYAPSGTACVFVSAPRPIGPLTTATVTSQRPTVRWALGSGSDGARIEFCHDRACALPIASLDVRGTSMRPTTALPPGVVFWRLTGMSGTTVGTAMSPVWHFTVGWRDSVIDSASGTTPDVNGDGYADVILADSVTRHIYVFHGTATGVATTPATTLSGTPSSPYYAGQMTGAGDVDGDGFTDVMFSNDAGRLVMVRGGPAGVDPTPSMLASNGLVSSAGDVNGDGYGDVLSLMPGYSSTPGSLSVYFGSPSGVSSTAGITRTGYYFNGSGGNADVNGDGYIDALVFTGADIFLFLGQASGLATTPIDIRALAAGAQFVGDVNGDGFDDVLAGYAGSSPSTTHLYLGNPSGLTDYVPGPSSGFATSPPARLGDVNGDGMADVGIDTGVYLGTSAGLANTAWTTMPYGVSAIGDVQADGYADMAAVQYAGSGTTPVVVFGGASSPGSACSSSCGGCSRCVTLSRMGTAVVLLDHDHPFRGLKPTATRSAIVIRG